MREVRVIGRRSDGVLVDGLSGGEEVITNATPAVKDGDRIERRQD